jgi:hypothetical protein
MVEIEPLQAISADEGASRIERITAAKDFRSALRRGRADLGQGRGDGRAHATKTDDEAVLSDVANVSLLEEEGKSVHAIAADLGLTAEAVLTDIAIAAGISHTPQ